MNIKILKSEMALKEISLNDLSKAMQISKSALYKKINGTSDFKRCEILQITDILKISIDRAIEIFFADNVS